MRGPGEIVDIVAIERIDPHQPRAGVRQMLACFGCEEWVLCEVSFPPPNGGKSPYIRAQLFLSAEAR
jgi:hypothetical protein